MTVHDRIEINPKIMVGKPVIRGTRIPVDGKSKATYRGLVTLFTYRFGLAASDVSSGSPNINERGWNHRNEARPESRQ